LPFSLFPSLHLHYSYQLKNSRSSSSTLLLLLLNLKQERTIDMRQHTTESDRRADECVEFFVASDCELEVAGGDALYF
jgi:hypothetical protein